jgi:hypothetical protein
MPPIDLLFLYIYLFIRLFLFSLQFQIPSICCALLSPSLEALSLISIERERNEVLPRERRKFSQRRHFLRLDDSVAVNSEAHLRKRLRNEARAFLCVRRGRPFGSPRRRRRRRTVLRPRFNLIEINTRSRAIERALEEIETPSLNDSRRKAQGAVACARQFEAPSLIPTVGADATRQPRALCIDPLPAHLALLIVTAILLPRRCNVKRGAGLAHRKDGTDSRALLALHLICARYRREARAKDHVEKAAHGVLCSLGRAASRLCGAQNAPHAEFLVALYALWMLELGRHPAAAPRHRVVSEQHPYWAQRSVAWCKSGGLAHAAMCDD